MVKPVPSIEKCNPREALDRAKEAPPAVKKEEKKTVRKEEKKDEKKEEKKEEKKAEKKA